jgi:hypothetical protein
VGKLSILKKARNTRRTVGLGWERDTGTRTFGDRTGTNNDENDDYLYSLYGTSTCTIISNCERRQKGWTLKVVPVSRSLYEYSFNASKVK